MMMDLYQKKALETMIVSDDLAIQYLSLGLASEVGEVLGKLKKMIRDDNNVLTDERRYAIMHELGDVFWYLAVLSHYLGFNLSTVASENIRKLSNRSKNGTISGDGDTR